MPTFPLIDNQGVLTILQLKLLRKGRADYRFIVYLLIIRYLLIIDTDKLWAVSPPRDERRGEILAYIVSNTGGSTSNQSRHPVRVLTMPRNLKKKTKKTCGVINVKRKDIARKQIMNCMKHSKGTYGN